MKEQKKERKARETIERKRQTKERKRERKKVYERGK